MLLTLQIATGICMEGVVNMDLVVRFDEWGILPGS